MIYLFLYFRAGRSGEISFGANEVAISCGYKPNPHQGKINDEISNFCDQLVSGGYIKVLYSDKQSKLYASLPLMEEQEPFALVQYSEFKKIIQSKNNHANTLLLLSYLRLGIYKKNRTKPEIFFSHISDVADKIGLSTRSVISSLHILADLGILYGTELPRYQDKYNNWHSGSYIFVNMTRLKNDKPDREYDWQEELKNGISWVKNQQLNYLHCNLI